MLNVSQVFVSNEHWERVAQVWAGQVAWCSAVAGLGDEAVGLVCEGGGVQAVSHCWFGGMVHYMPCHFCIARSQLFAHCGLVYVRKHI